MQHPVTYIEIATLVTLLVAIIPLVRRARSLFSTMSIPALALIFLVFWLVYSTFLLLEWVLASDQFDRMEDFTGVLAPMFWAFLFYGILQHLFNSDLAQSKKQYQLVVDNINEVIVELDDRYRILFASPSFWDTFGKSENEVKDAAFLSVIRAKDEASLSDFLDRVKAPPYGAYHEAFVDTPSGFRWFAWNAKCLFESSENRGSILLVGRDTTGRRKAEQALQESNARHREFIENQPVGLFRTKIEGDGRFVMANASMARIFGYPSVAALLDTPVITIYKDPGQRQALVDKLLNEEKLSGVELEGNKRDGTPLVVNMAMQLIKDSDGNPAYVDGTIEDITSRKLMEKQLRLTQLAFDKASVGIFQIDKDARILKVNDRACRNLGYTRDELCRMRLMDIDPTFSYEKFLTHRKTLKRTQARILETIHRRKDGSTFPVEITANYHEFEGEEIVISFQTDITERKTAEKTLRKREQLHLAAQRIARLGHWEHQVGNDHPVWSDEMYRIFEIEQEEFDISYDVFIKKIHPDDRAKVEETVAAAWEKGTEIDLVHRLLLPGEKIKFVHAKGNAQRNKKGEVVKIIGTIQDITLLKEAEIEWERSEQKLLQSQKLEAIGTLAGGIAHDFNNILTSIIGFAELAAGETPPGHPTKVYLKQVLQAGLRARDLVSHILTFSRQSDQVVEPLQLQIIIKEVIKLLRASIPANIEIRQEIASTCCSVLADPVQIHQIVMNLCTNAYQAIGKRNGHITIALKEMDPEALDFHGESDLHKGKCARLSIMDTGQGMDQITQGKIFDPYFTTKKKGEGTGLGLAVVHGIVKKHHGHITVSSEPGHETSFHVYLPCAETFVTVHRDRAETADFVGGSEHILLVDDEISITDLQLQILKRLGYRVTAFNSANEAIEVFQAQPEACDLVITDLTMPVMGGEELARRIRAIDARVPIFIQTGFSETVSREELDRIGIAGLLKKPVLVKELAQSIRRALDASKDVLA